jgi:hypothetical protein
MNENNNDQQQKQQYLRENILDKGYNANEFMEYFKESVGVQEIDLNNYTMNSLIEVVNGFYSKKGLNQNEQNAFLSIPNELKSDSEHDNNNSNSNHSNSNGQNGAEEIVKCVQMEKTDISKIDNLEIKIAYPEKVEPGIFSKPYMTYSVSCNFPNLNIRKRYSDFEWLYQKLKDHFINCIIPPLCKKKFYGTI